MPVLHDIVPRSRAADMADPGAVASTGTMHAMAAPDVAGFPVLPARYRALRRLGRGGFAEVILAEDLGGDPSPKAVKIPLGDVPRAVIDAFRGEFRILASLEHPGLARVFDFGELPDGRAYYTAELVQGARLGSGGVPSLRDACLAMAAVCRTLAYIHARGYLHNDVTPSNILVGAAREAARLLDFGLAGLDRAGSRTVAGTPGYIAPERLAGQAWDARADLYSVGATLYRVLAGRRVVDIERPAAALARLRQGFRPLARLRPDVPGALAGLVEQLLSLDPARRPRHPSEVIGRLGDVLGETIPLETPGTARCYTLSSLLVGRDAELVTAAATLRAAGTGEGPRILAITGAPGMGKSRLLREIVWRAETEGWRAAAITCADREPAEQPLLRLLALVGAEEADISAGGEAAAAALLSAAGGVRTVFVIDDAERAADAAWHVAFALARRAAARREPAALILGFDPDRLSTAARGHLALGESSAGIVRVELAAVGPPAIRSMLASLWGEGVIPARMQADIASRSGGVPLLVEEIVGEMVETGAIRGTPSGWTAQEPTPGSAARSTRLEDFLRRRCTRLAPDAARTLVALAALGGRAESEALAAVAEPGTDVGLGTALLVDRKFATVAAGLVTVAHEALSGVAIETVAEHDRLKAHAAAAAWLLAHGADDAELARAYRGAGDPEAAFRHGLAAGRRARESGEGRQAVRWLEETREAAAAAGIAGQSVADAERLLAQAYEMVGRNADAMGASGRAFEALPADAARERVRVATCAVRPALFRGDFDSAEAWLARAAAVALPGDPLGAVLVHRAAATVAWLRGRAREARERFRMALAGLDGAGDDLQVPSLRAALLSSLAGVEVRFEVEAARACGRAALEAVETLSDRSLTIVALLNVGMVEAVSGDLVAAVAAFSRGLDACEKTGDLRNLSILLSNLAEAEHLCGDGQAARILIERAAACDPEAVRFAVANTEAVQAWREGDLARAEARSTQALASGLRQDFLLLLRAIVAAAAVERGAGREADEAAVLAEAEAQTADSPLDLAHARLSRAYAAAAEDPARAGWLLREAADALLAIGHRLDAPTVLRDAARWLARGGLREAARGCLARARKMLVEAGRRPEMERLETIERSFGEPPPPARPRVEGATDRGPDTAALLAEILSAPSLEHLASRLRLAAAATGRSAPALAAVEAAGSGPAPSIMAASGDAPSMLSAEGASRLIEISLGPVEVNGRFPDIVGRGPAMRRVLALVDRLAETDVPVLLLGETGTGKELLARALHAASPRAAAPFVAVNCGAVPAALAESELFGHAPGAFTGAGRERYDGYFQQARGGTLFLDEVGELPLAVQPKLLRTLDEGEVRPLGGQRAVRVDVRVVAATNRDLRREVSERRFRKDLYFRLAGVEVTLPPLRKRPEDIPALVQHILSGLGQAAATAGLGEAAAAATPAALDALAGYRWPGNVRELHNELERAAALCKDGVILPEHLSPAVRGAALGLPGRPKKLREATDVLHRKMIAAALQAAGGNRARAARALGLQPPDLHHRMERLGIRPPKPSSR